MEGFLGGLADSALASKNWLLQHSAEDGFLPTTERIVESCYKGIWSLYENGASLEASRVADFVKQWMDQSGDIPEPRRDVAFLTEHYLYANTYLAIGAHLLGRFDLSLDLYRFIRTRQHNSGGFLSHQVAFSGEQYMDSVSTAIAGITALFLGDVNVATGAAEFLRNLILKQPSPEERFYTTLSVNGYFLEPDSQDNSHRAIQVREEEQDWYFIGINVVFLTLLYLGTREHQHLALAERLMKYMDDMCHEEVFASYSSGKAGVGASLLYSLTGKQRYFEIATSIAEFIKKKQHPAGFWQEEDNSFSVSLLSASDLDMTLEYALWLRLISRFLGSRI